MDKKVFDTIIIGGGPGGYTAALYCARAGLSTLILEKLSPGGQMATTTLVENYPGFEEGIDGFDLGEKMKLSADKFGAVTELVDVTDIDLSQKIKKVTTSEGDFYGKTIIIATGASPRELGIEKEKELVGKGVAYCATCDGMLYKNKTVIIVGGGNSAIAEALFLSKICSKVYMIHRRDSFRGSKVYMNSLNRAENLEILWNSKVIQLISDKKLTGAVIENVVTKEKTTLDAEALFVAIGREPNSELVKGKVSIDEHGYIIADETTKTNVDGIFAVGDVRTKVLRQIVTAASDGAVASKYVEDYLALND